MSVKGMIECNPKVNVVEFVVNNFDGNYGKTKSPVSLGCD